MSQTVVTKFYSTRKRFKDPGKSFKNLEQQDLAETFNKDNVSTVILDPPKEKVAKNKAKGKKVNKVTNYLKPQPKNSKSEVDAPPDKTEIPRTPKRHLSSPDELTPSKKIPLVLPEAQVSQDISPGKLQKSELLTPKKLDPNARRKLQLRTPNRFVSPRKIASPLKNGVSPQKAATYENINSKDLGSLLNESRSKILFSGKLDQLKKSLEKFSQVSTKTKEFQSNSYKITSVISSAKKNDQDTPKPALQGEYKKYTYLAAPDSHSFTLPYKYKLLAETFRCVDTVVSMLNNRKEKITFEKMKNGVQKMMSKNFLKSHLGQIVTVYPSAYSLQYEKNESYVRNNKDSLPYELIITPVLSDENDNTSNESSSNKSKKNTKTTFIHMTPQLLVERKKEFLYKITNIVKKHHQDFLTRLNIPIPPENTIVRWHLKFQVDSVPDIPVAELPEEPETKVHSAKDVLNKIRGSVRGTRIEKALQSVADKSKTETKVENSQTKDSSKNNSLNKKQNKALNGVCSELLAKIRAREQAKLFENMTRSVHDEKRSAMLERLPKIVHILWHYFIAERKAAVPVDSAIEKIIHSYNSLATPEEVKKHLQLITETMPGWLSFIKISKGEYITMDKKKDINEMIANIK